MNVPAYAIGLPEEWVAEIKDRSEVRYIAQSPVVPAVFTRDGKAWVESHTTPGRMLQPNIILWYGYFPESRQARTALAISNTPTFPNIRKTLPLDDKTMAVILAQEADAGHQVSRGYGLRTWGPNTVLKWGDSHCGENKQLLVNGDEPVDQAIRDENVFLNEPFVEGESHRILVVGVHASQLVYESTDWRKNVQGTITRLRTVDPDLGFRTRQLMERLGLLIAGVDYVIGKETTMLLEVNAYPSLDEDDAAKERFLALATRAVRGAQEAQDCS